VCKETKSALYMCIYIYAYIYVYTYIYIYTYVYIYKSALYTCVYTRSSPHTQLPMPLVFLLAGCYFFAVWVSSFPLTRVRVFVKVKIFRMRAQTHTYVCMSSHIVFGVSFNLNLTSLLWIKFGQNLAKFLSRDDQETQILSCVSQIPSWVCCQET